MAYLKDDMYYVTWQVWSEKWGWVGLSDAIFIKKIILFIAAILRKIYGKILVFGHFPKVLVFGHFPTDCPDSVFK